MTLPRSSSPLLVRIRQKFPASPSLAYDDLLHHELAAILATAQVGSARRADRRTPSRADRQSPQGSVPAYAPKTRPKRLAKGPAHRPQIKPGARIAVAVGSRGINDLAAIVQAVIRALQSAGAQPFVIPAMGSHGGGTPAGQTALLASYGVTEAALGVPVRAAM